MKRKKIQKVQSLFMIIMMLIMMMPGTAGTAVVEADVGDPVELRINGNSDGNVEVSINGGAPELYVENATLSVLVGDVVVLKAIPTRKGYVFDRWVLGGPVKPTENPYTLTISESPPTVGTQFRAGDSLIVTFDSGEGVFEGDIESIDQSVEFGGTAIVPTTVLIAPEGYHFSGWSPAEFGNITSDVTFTAQYDIDMYTVTFDSGEGVFEGNVESIDQSVAFGGTAVPPVTALIAPEGYHFSGWSPAEFGNITGDVTFTAQYDIDMYTATFDSGAGIFEGNVESIDQSVASGGTAIVPITALIAPEGYHFSGWSPAEFGNITGDVTFTAQYDINMYTATFDSGAGIFEGNVESIDQSVASGGTAVPPATALIAPEGYHFSGWSPAEFGNITGDVTFTAQYEINTYTVTFDSGAGVFEGDVESIEQNVEHGSGAVVPTTALIAPEGYHFSGWSPEDLSNIQGEATFTAQYEINTYAVTFDSGEGVFEGDVESIEQSVAHGSDAVVPATALIAPEGYHFSGWSPEDLSNIQGEATFIAQYEINTYAVTFDSGEGAFEGDVESIEQSVAHGSDAVVPATALIAPEGYHFSGWFPEDLSNIQGEATFTAQYEINTYAVTFDSGEGVFEGDVESIEQSVAHGSDAVPPATALNAPEGYHFSGWSPEDLSNIQGEATFIAQYALNTYTVTFDPGANGVLVGDGNSIFAAYGEYIEESLLPQITANDGWLFDEWDYDFATTPITEDVLATATYVQQQVVLTIVDVGTGDSREITYIYGDSVVAGDLGLDKDGFTYDTNIDLPFTIIQDTTLRVTYTQDPVVVPATEEPDDPAPAPTVARGNDEVIVPADDEVVVESEDIIPLEDEINDDPIAQASVDDGFNFWWLLLLLLPLLFFILWWNRVVPIVEGVADNKDGTYTVTWGYNNRKIKDVEYEKDDSMVNLLTGTVIRGEEPPVEFERGRHENVFKTIVDKNAKVEWNIKRKKALADVLEQLKKNS